MVFGGLFGGSSNNNNDKDKNNASSEFAPSQPDTQNSTPLTSSPFSSPTSSTSSASSTEIKQRLQQAIAQQSNILNAKALISKVNETCFDHCVTAPGDRLSGKEEGCLSACMEKYIEGWNVVSKSYVGRIQRDGPGLLAGAGGNGDGVF